ncbi:MAG: TolC family protein [Bryobacterales bacterium]|nr:TolC family protein [Bryobacteraceae bacterium]MDW8355117.1 TolC family protein [Bryobacterales bacterium]
MLNKTVWLLLVLSAGAAAQPAAVPLTLKQAVALALAPEGNARWRLAHQLARQAEQRAAQSRAALLPSLEGSLAEQNQTRNLAAFGIRIEAPIPGFRVPDLVGPFTTFDARAAVRQTVLDLAAWRRYQAVRETARAARAEEEAVRDAVAREVALLYLALLRAEARLEAARANVRLAERLLDLARNQKAAGTGTGIEVTRAEVQLANERQQALAAELETRRARLELLRAIGLALDTPVAPASSLEYVPPPEVDLAALREAALRTRADYRAQLLREESARLAASGAAAERLPSVAAFADYGSLGTSLANSLPTRVYGLAVRVPLFDGGLREARRQESRSLYEQERIRTAELRRQIELDIRLAADALASALEQVKVAGEGLGQTLRELEQAERRYRAGVAASLEVTDAQTRLARARENRVAALFLYHRARLELAYAVGGIRQFVEEEKVP